MRLPGVALAAGPGIVLIQHSKFLQTRGLSRPDSPPSIWCPECSTTSKMNMSYDLDSSCIPALKLKLESRTEMSLKQILNNPFENKH